MQHQCQLARPLSHYGIRKSILVAPLGKALRELQRRRFPSRESIRGRHLRTFYFRKRRRRVVLSFADIALNMVISHLASHTQLPGQRLSLPHLIGRVVRKYNTDDENSEYPLISIWLSFSASFTCTSNIDNDWLY